MNLSSTVLALLVALVSVLSLALPPLITALRSGQSSISISHPSVRGTSVYVFVSNRGTSPGLIVRGEIESNYLPFPVDLEVLNPGDGFVGPGNKQVGFSVLLGLDADASNHVYGELLEGEQDASKSVGWFIVWTQESDGTSYRNRMPLSVSNLASLLGHHADYCRAAAARMTRDSNCSIYLEHPGVPIGTPLNSSR